jgi:hypothetical protein
MHSIPHLAAGARPAVNRHYFQTETLPARRKRSTKPSRTPSRRPIQFQSSSRRRPGALVVPEPSFKGAILRIIVERHTDCPIFGHLRDSHGVLSGRRPRMLMSGVAAPASKCCRCWPWSSIRWAGPIPASSYITSSVGSWSPPSSNRANPSACFQAWLPVGITVDS